MYWSAPTSAADQSPGRSAGMMRATAARRVRRWPLLSTPLGGGAAGPARSGAGMVAASAPAAPARPAPSRKSRRVYLPLAVSIESGERDHPVDVVGEAALHLVPRDSDRVAALDLHGEVLGGHVAAVAGARERARGGRPCQARDAPPTSMCQRRAPADPWRQARPLRGKNRYLLAASMDTR